MQDGGGKELRFESSAFSYACAVLSHFYNHPFLISLFPKNRMTNVIFCIFLIAPSPPPSPPPSLFVGVQLTGQVHY